MKTDIDRLMRGKKEEMKKCYIDKTSPSDLIRIWSHTLYVKEERESDISPASFHCLGNKGKIYKGDGRKFLQILISSTLMRSK